MVQILFARVSYSFYSIHGILLYKRPYLLDIALSSTIPSSIHYATTLIPIDFAW